MLDKSIIALKDNDSKILYEISEMENRVDQQSKDLSSHHIVRLEEGRCTIESGIVFLEIVNHFERIADHIHKTSLLTRDELQGTPRVDFKGSSK